MSSRIVGKSIQGLDGWELFIAVIVILVGCIGDRRSLWMIWGIHVVFIRWFEGIVDRKDQW